MNSRLHNPWKLIAVMAGGALLSACSSDGGGDWLSLFKAARETWENRDAPVALDEAASIPYATLGLRIDGGREQIVILATDTDGERLWTSAARIALVTRNGRIVRTAGFGTDLTGYSPASYGEENWIRPHAFVWSGDFADLKLYSVRVTCDVAPLGPDPITILGKQFQTIRVSETCHSDKPDWTFTNTYWLTPDSGRVWRSIVHTHPRGPLMEIELLRPPASAM